MQGAPLISNTDIRNCENEQNLTFTDAFKNSRRDLWFLGDFNVDYLDRTNDNRSKYIGVLEH